jgi:hypothetical protein
LVINKTDKYDPIIQNEIDYYGNLDEFANDLIAISDSENRKVNDLSSLTKVDFDKIWYPSKMVRYDVSCPASEQVIQCTVDSCPVSEQVIQSTMTVPMNIEFINPFPEPIKTLNAITVPMNIEFINPFPEPIKTLNAITVPMDIEFINPFPEPNKTLNAITVPMDIEFINTFPEPIKTLNGTLI